MQWMRRARPSRHVLGLQRERRRRGRRDQHNASQVFDVVGKIHERIRAVRRRVRCSPAEQVWRYAVVAVGQGSDHPCQSARGTTAVAQAEKRRCACLAVDDIELDMVGKNFLRGSASMLRKACVQRLQIPSPLRRFVDTVQELFPNAGLNACEGCVSPSPEGRTSAFARAKRLSLDLMCCPSASGSAAVSTSTSARRRVDTVPVLSLLFDLAMNWRRRWTSAGTMRKRGLVQSQCAQVLPLADSAHGPRCTRP